MAQVFLESFDRDSLLELGLVRLARASVVKRGSGMRFRISRLGTAGLASFIHTRYPPVTGLGFRV